MTYSQQQTEIKRITNRLANSVNRWKQEGADLVKRVNQSIDLELDCFSFDKESTRATLKSVVLLAFANNNKTSYRIVFPEWHMDVNGNYTTNPKLWA